MNISKNEKLISANLDELREEDKKMFSGKKFDCAICGKRVSFENLRVFLVPSGFDYICPNDRNFILVSEKIQDMKADLESELV